MPFIGFFFIVYLLYNCALFIVDTAFYTAMWQNNTVNRLLSKNGTALSPTIADQVTEKTGEQFTAIDKTFNAALSNMMTRRQLRSFDGALRRCHVLQKQLHQANIAIKKARSQTGLTKQDVAAAVMQSVVNAFPTFFLCTLERL